MAKSILWKFEFSATTVFTIEVGELYMRFFKQGLPVTSGGSTYELVTPYAAADVFQLQPKQVNDVIYVTHPDYNLRKISRIADNSWTIEEVEPENPALLDENVSDTTLTPSATSGAITLTASASLFDSEHVGSRWRIGHEREGDSDTVEIDANKSGPAKKIFGEWNVRSYGTWDADILVQRSDDSGTTWKTIRKMTGESNRNVNVVGEAETDAQYRIKIENYVSNTLGRAVLEWNDHIVYGVVEITAFGSATSVTAEVVTTLSETSATEYWSEGAWSTYRGFPRAVTIHEQRLVVGGTSYQPSTIWGSVSGDLENFKKGSADADAYIHTIAGLELNAINWMVSQKELLIGTAGMEWSAGSDGAAITASDIQIRLQSNKGSDYQSALVVNDSVLFVGRKGRKIFDIEYTSDTEKFRPTDLTLFSEHITEGGIVQIAFQKEPIPILWAVTGSGKLIGLTFDKDQQVIGWHSHDTDGLFESVVATYGEDGEDDSVYVIVARTIGGAVTRFIERFDPTQWTEKNDYYGVDSGLTYEGAPATTFSGLNHLGTEDIDVLADGATYQGITLDGAGGFELPSGSAAASTVHAGLPFVSELKPFRLDADTQLGIHMGRQKRIGDLYLRLLDSVGFKYIIGDATYDGEFELPVLADAGDGIQDLFSGELPVDFSTGHSDDPQIRIQQTYPLPLHILAIIAFYDVTG